MIDSSPLVTIGIPTYNRDSLVRRAINSAQCQDYSNLQIVVSDNCSTDATQRVCKELSSQDCRILYVRQGRNIGATQNFDAVLTLAKGKYFMWLGDDDFIDDNYISVTLRALEGDPTVAIASGLARYYNDGALIDHGRKFSIDSSYWWHRIVRYYWNVSDNGVFYGLMRTSVIRKVLVRNALAGDWLAIACVAAAGKIVMIDEATVHRELGGASRTHGQAAKSLGLSRIQALLPRISIAVNAYVDISIVGKAYEAYGSVQRHLVGTLVFLVLLIRAASSSAAESLVKMRSHFLSKADVPNGP